MANPIESYAADTVFAASDWLPLSEVTNPTHPGYVVAPQTDTRAWPINRNGQIVPSTTLLTHRINLNASGARFFTLRNPRTNVTNRAANVYVLEITDVTHIPAP